MVYLVLLFCCWLGMLDTGGRENQCHRDACQYGCHEAIHRHDPRYQTHVAPLEHAY